MIFGDKSIDSLSGGLKTLTGRFTDYIKTLDVAKLKTVGLKVATVALESVMTLGITMAISAIVEGVNKFIHAQEEAAEEERRFWQTIDDNVNKLEQEKTAVDDLIAKYSDLVFNSANNANVREDLAKLQDQTIKDYSLEADAIDLVNGKYSEQLKTLQDLKKEKADAFLYDENNIKAYEDALNKLSNAGEVNGLLDIEFKLFDSEESFKKIIDQWQQSGLFDSYEKMVGASRGTFFGFDLANQDALTIYQTLEKMAESYKKLSSEAGNFNEKQYAVIKQQAVAAKEYYDKYKAFVDLYEKNKSIAEFTLPKETQEQFDELIDKAKILYDEISGDGSAERKFIATEKLRELKTELYDIANNNDDLKILVDDFFGSMDKGTSVALQDINSLKEAWLNTLDDMQKGSLKNISTMVSALQDLSENKGIAANTFWQLIEFDEEGLLSGARLVGDKFYVAQENLIKLKDRYVQSQIDSIRYQQVEIENQKKQYEEQVKLLQLRLNAWKFSEKPLTNVVSRKEYEKLNSELENAKRGAKEFGDEWERNNWLIEYLNQSLGNTIDKQKELESMQKEINKQLTNLNKELDNYVKAHEKVIDGIVKGLENEQKELESQKQTLQDELDVLNDQKDVLEDTIKQYESLNKLVQDTIQKEIDSIEESYKKKIDALKAENDERKDALDYAQKLANLENAHNNKRRVYDETRGWRYESVKEDIVKAESDLADFENNQAIKDLEKERDSILKDKNDYLKQWGEVLDAVKTEEDEILAVEIFGADWRQKIAEGDIDIMEKFQTFYTSYNTSLNNLTKTEIKMKEESIKAKDAEIAAKKKQVDAWKEYKTEVTTAVTEIKNANEEYMGQIGSIELAETSSLEERQAAFEKFKENVAGYVNDIANKQTELDRLKDLQDELGGEIHYDITVDGVDELKQAAAAGAVVAATGGAMAGIGGVMAIANNPISQTANDVVDAISQIMNRLNGYSQGGVADYTGIAMLHGRKNAPETIFNAKDSAKLYDMVHNTPNLIANAMTEAQRLAGFKLNNNTNTNNSNVNVSIGAIYANNPTELTQGLDKQLDQYFKNKLTQNYTTRQ